MAVKRIILEMGSGNDLHGRDYTKAALRAVQDALHHSSIVLFKSLNLDRDAMQIDVTIGVARPELVDKQAVAASLPYGQVSVHPVLGGLDVPDAVENNHIVIATAGIEVRYEIPEGQFKPAT